MEYFYHSTYKSGNAVTSSVKANFTLSPYSEEEIEIMSKNNVSLVKFFYEASILNHNYSAN